MHKKLFDKIVKHVYNYKIKIWKNSNKEYSNMSTGMNFSTFLFNMPEVHN
jgi:hypothetical protein